MARLLIRSLALLAFAQGCIIIDDTDENAGAACDDAREDGACFAITAACPPDAVTYSVFVHPVGAAAGFEPDTFDCGTGGLELVDPGTYDLRVEATTAEGDVLFGSEAFRDQEVEDLQDVPLAFDFPTGEGFFWVNWTLDQGGSSIACEDIGAVSVEVESTLTDGGTSTTDVFPCVYGGWQTRGLDLGEYDLRIALIDDGGGVLAQTDPILTDLTIDSGLVEVPAVTFVIEAAAR